MNFSKWLSKGRHPKLQALACGVIALCLGVFVYGMVMYADAPYRPCDDGPYCGKLGAAHSYATYQGWKRWEGLLLACWPFGMIAAYGLRRLRKED